MDISDRDLLVKIHTQTEMILKRLDSGDGLFADLDDRADGHDKRIAAAENRLRDLDGGDGWPSFVDLQKAHLRRNTIYWIFGGAWGILVAGGGVLASWLGLSIWHARP